MYTIVLVNVKRFRALCGFYAIENKLLLLLLYSHIEYLNCVHVRVCVYTSEKQVKNNVLNRAGQPVTQQSILIQVKTV